MARSKALKRRLYNVSAAAHYLLDEQHSLYLRAIRLYEMQIAVFFGEKLNAQQRKRKEFPDRWLAVPSDILAAARVCSVIKLIEYIKRTRRLGGTALPSLLDDHDAREVLSRVLKDSVGLKKLNIGLRPRALDSKLRKRRSWQRRYAPLYDVSLRWRIEPGSKLEGGPSTAALLFKPKQRTDAHDTIRRYYPHLGGKSRTSEIVDKGHFLAAFVWLSQYDCKKFRPRQVEKATFARKLLRETQDITHLKQIFGRYEFIKTRLEGRNYALLTLDLGNLVPPEPVVIRALEEDLLDAIFSVRLSTCN